MKEAKILNITVYCPVLGEIALVDKDKIHAYGHAQDCEVCGSHGDVKITVYCVCGKSHDITLNEW